MDIEQEEQIAQETNEETNYDVYQETYKFAFMEELANQEWIGGESKVRILGSVNREIEDEFGAQKIY